MLELILPALAASSPASRAELLEGTSNVLPPQPDCEDLQRLMQTLFAPDTAAGGCAARVEVLKRCDARARALVPQLVARAQGGGGAESDDTRFAAQTAQRILLGIHDGFKRVALDLSRETSRLFGRGALIEALSLSLGSAWEVAALHARIYASIAPGFWTDCHRMFAYLHGRGWEAKQGGRDVEPLGVLYRRVLLLGMAGANRLEPPKIELLIELVRREASRVELIKPPRPAGGGSAFVFRPEADLPGRFLETFSAAEGATGWWTVDLGRVAGGLAKRAATLQNGGQMAQHELQLLLRLQREWASPPRRRHCRQSRTQGEQVEFVTLLSACWQTAQRTAGKPEAAEWGVSLEAGEFPDDDVDAQPAMLSICNESASGFLLEGEPAHPMCAGELAMLRRAGQDWQLGVIRWVSFSAEKANAQCGVELIGRSPEAVLARPIVSHPGSRCRLALQLRGGRILVLAGRYFQPSREFLVEDGVSQVVVRARRIVMQTALYQVFLVRNEEVGATPRDV